MTLHNRRTLAHKHDNVNQPVSRLRQLDAQEQATHNLDELLTALHGEERGPQVAGHGGNGVLSRVEFTIRWRLNDPAEENSQRWTKTHICVASHKHDSDVRTFCGLRVPDFPYDSEYDVETGYCQSCLDKSGKRDES